MTQAERLKSCHCCGLVQHVGLLGRGMVARCPRCETVVRTARRPRSKARTAAFALAALALYPAAMTLPVLEVTRFGHMQDATIWSGVTALFEQGQVWIGIVVLVASIVAPVVKLLTMIALCLPARAAQGHRALAYRLVEWIGRWGMLDVLLVAVLVAVVKLGEVVRVQPGPGLVAFAGVVILSLLASAVFDPHSIWEDSE